MKAYSWKYCLESIIDPLLYGSDGFYSMQSVYEATTDYKRSRSEFQTSARSTAMLRTSCLCLFLQLCSLLLIPSLCHSQGEWGEKYCPSCSNDGCRGIRSNQLPLLTCHCNNSSDANSYTLSI